MTRDEFYAWATSHGWIPDRFGHLQKSGVSDGQPPSQYRLKLSRIAARYEVKSSAGWVRLRSGYYSAVSINADGKLIGMKF